MRQYYEQIFYNMKHHTKFCLQKVGVTAVFSINESGVQICPVGLNPIFISVDHDQYQAAGQMHNFTKL